MRDAIAERAKANGRSMNSEIVQILQDALDEKEHPKVGLTAIPAYTDAAPYKDEQSPEFMAALNLARVLMVEAEAHLSKKK